MLQKLPVSGFNWVKNLCKFNEDSTKSYNQKSNEGYFFKVDVQYPKNSHEPRNGLQFLPEMKNVGKVKNLVVNLQDKKEYITPIKIPRQALNHVLVLKKKIKN